MNVPAELASLQRINDRLISTSNEDLQRVLEALLPKLLPLSNNEELREKQVVPILMHILRRIKPLETRLPLQALISLVRPDMLPFCCNLSMVFIDAAKKWHPSECWKECSLPLMNGLQRFLPFSPQSNALCYYSLSCIGPLSTTIIPILPTSENIPGNNPSSPSGNITENNARNVLGDWFLDFSLAQPGIIKGSAGSIQPGLSAERLARLTTKKNEWNNVDMKGYKLELIGSLVKQWLPTPCAVAIAIILSCDIDSDVSIQAVFKMNGARSILSDINENPVPVIELLLALCLPISQTMQQKYVQNMYVRQRTTLRNNVKCAILRWICKEMTDYLTLAGKSIVQLIVSEMFKSSDISSIDSQYVSNIMELSALLIEKLKDDELLPIASILLQCAKKALVPFVSLLSSQSTSSVDSESGTSFYFLFILTLFFILFYLLFDAKLLSFS